MTSPFDTLYFEPFTTVEIEIRQDEDWDDSFRVVALDESAAETAIDLTGALVELQILPAYGFGSPIVRLSTETFGVALDDPESGDFGIFVPQATVATWPKGEWVHFVRYREAGLWKELWRGPLHIVPGI